MQSNELCQFSVVTESSEMSRYTLCLSSQENIWVARCGPCNHSSDVIQEYLRGKVTITVFFPLLSVC